LRLSVIIPGTPALPNSAPTNMISANATFELKARPENPAK
jgi:hypothetical protein